MKKMTKSLFYFMLISVLLLIGVLIYLYFKNSNSISIIQSIPFKTENGWGYNILVNDKIYIHQEYIPAINGKQSFQSRLEAQETGILVIKKIKKGQMPVIKTKDLDSLKVRYVTI
jgi:hypothetical protein